MKQRLDTVEVAGVQGEAMKLAVRQGFEPWVQVLARTTV